MLARSGSAKFDAILIATGSEVDLAMQAMRALAGEGIAVRVVSMPCTNVFDRAAARIPRTRAAVVVPQARRGRSRRDGLLAQVRRSRRRVVGIDTFGESAPAEALFKHFGFTVEHVVAAVKSLI